MKIKKFEEKDDVIIIGDGKFTIDKTSLDMRYLKEDEQKNCNNYHQYYGCYDHDHGNHCTYLITGNIKNETKKNYSILYLDFKLYDDAGVVIGIARAPLSDLDPGETVRFRAGYYGPQGEENIKNLKFSKLSTWW